MSLKKIFHSRCSLLVCASALSAAFLSFSGSALAAPAAATQQAVPAKKTASTESQIFGQHQQKKPLSVAERRLAQDDGMTARLSYDSTAQQQENLLRRPSRLSVNQSKAQLKGTRVAASVASAAACDRQLFASASGAALVNAVQSSTTSCINDLFGVSGAQAAAIFKESQMLTIADAFRTAAAGYNGTNSGSALQMVLFLRAGYYVQFYDTAVGSYGNNLKTAMRAAMDAFVNNGNFGAVNDVHGEILSEFVTLIDSATENARYLTSVVKRLLNSYNSSYNAYYWMKSAVNNGFNVLFRAHQNADFKALVLADPSIIDTLYNFVNANFNLLGGAEDYLASNGGRELGRFLQYADGSAIKSLAKSRAKTLLDRSNITGNTASLWVGVGEMIENYDKANCSYYNLCDFVQRVETAVLPIKHSCSPTLRLRAQSLTAAQLQEACSIVGGEEGYFHTQLASGKIPVASDNNSQLEMVVFSSSKDYKTYAGTLFGIDTNNGGMYLEGDPSAAGNQARFIAYQAEWLLPKFEIWNLTHEYIHYLDGRFDMFGDFGAAMTQKTVWWVEGLAEYISYSYRKQDYAGAKTQAAAGTYPLSTVFQNDYSSGQTRVYNWGYLAVRYMFEKQRSKVASVLGYFRPGNYTGYAGYMTSAAMAASMDADFKAWLPCVNDASLPNCTATPVNVLPVANFTSEVVGLKVYFTDKSTDSDGSIASRRWTFGDGSTSSFSRPSKTYASAGTYQVTLTVTDNKGGKASVSQSVRVVQGNNLPECSGVAAALGQNCVKSNLSATAGNYVYMYLYVPEGSKTIRFSTSGGSGNADLFVNTLGSWATRDYYNYGSYTSGNNESITVTNPPVGYIYISLYAQSGFSGVSIKTEF